MNEFKDSIDMLTAEVKLMKNALIGTEYGETGIVNKQIEAEAKIEELKNKVEKLEHFRTKIIAYALGVGAGAGAVVSLLTKIIISGG